MKVCIINLERSARRRDAIGRRLNELGIAHTFVRAVDATAGEHLAFPNCIDNRPSRTGRPLTPGEHACFASHYLTWKSCFASGQPIVVMEDDILCDREAGNALALVAALSAERPFVRLCGLLPRQHRTIRELGGYRLVQYWKGPSGGQAYMVSPDGARRLLAKADRWIEPLDDYLDRFWIHGVPSLGLLPYRISRAEGDSEIGTRPPLTWAQTARRKVRRLPDGMLRAAWNARHP